MNDGACLYCGEMTDRFSGRRWLWPTHLSWPNEPGVRKPHHCKCVCDHLPESNGDADIERLRFGVELLMRNIDEDQALYLTGMIEELMNERPDIASVFMPGRV